MENVLAGRARAGASTCFHRLLVTTAHAVNLRSARARALSLLLSFDDTPTTTILLARAPAFAMDAICELHLLAKALKHAEI
eukprot:COSAG06_NODE_3826_length_4863_cov_8.304156_1_plen_80_part_10